MRARVSLDREELDRLVLMTMDVDRYEAQLIPELNARVQDLEQALAILVAAVRDTSRENLVEAMGRAERALGA